MTSRARWDKLDCLNAIELNSSFYRTPSVAALTKLRDSLPVGVEVVPKVAKYITHTKRLKDVQDSWQTYWERLSILGPERLRTVLFQMPPSFRRTDETVERIRALKGYLPQSLNVVFEFRDVSWLVPETYALFTELQWCVAGTSIKKADGNTRWLGTMPSGLYIPPRTCSYSYLRVHGQQGYKGGLSKDEVLSLRKQLGKLKVSTSYVFFNNVFFANRSDYCIVETVTGPIDMNYAAVCNAIELSDIVGSSSSNVSRLNIVGD